VDSGICGFPVCLLWGDVADSGVDPPPIAIAFDVGEQVAPRGMPIGVFGVVDQFGFQGTEEPLDRRIVPALSQQFALRLIDWMMAVACRILR
jgi:hypothetical protein